MSLSITGSVVVASEGSIGVIRNPDAFIPGVMNTTTTTTKSYLVSKIQPSDPEVTQAITKYLRAEMSNDVVITVSRVRHRYCNGGRRRQQLCW